MRINYKRSQMGMLGGVFLLMAVTLYMAIAGPYVLFNLKQSETTEIKTVIVVARHGDEWPPSEAYFLGEPVSASTSISSEQQVHLAGQLTNTGKERMFLLGKFLKMRYYDRILKGDPNRVQVRSADSDKCLESAQLLVTGLNPPQTKWVWSPAGSPYEELASKWQPKAIHSTEQHWDDLLSSRSKCLLNYETFSSGSQAWKNSTKYMQLLNEFRHDQQVLRQNTGLEFEDDLEMLSNIEEHLKARAALGTAPSWYTTTLAQRLAHIADVTQGCKFDQIETQRLYSGRLLDSIARNIFAQIHNEADAASDFTLAMTEDEDELDRLKSGLHSDQLGRSLGFSPSLTGALNSQKALPLHPGMSIYLTDKQHLTALLNALKIYSTQPHYGFLLIIELHHDPSNKVHFLRLYTVNSQSHNTFPEPVRVNPIACPIDSVECSPEQFEQNIRHLTVDKRTWWKKLCKNLASQATDNLDTIQQASTITTTQQLDSTKATTTTTSQDYYDKLDGTLIVGPSDLRPTTTEIPTTSNPTLKPTTNSETTTQTAASTNTTIDQMTTTARMEPTTSQTQSVKTVRSNSLSEIISTIDPKDEVLVVTGQPESSDELNGNSLTKDVFYTSE